jgi:hypothetical protein
MACTLPPLAAESRVYAWFFVSVTLATSLAFLALAVICTLWNPHVDTQGEGNQRWIDVVILLSIITSLILLLIAIFKLVCGRGDLFARPDDYEEIEDDGTPHLGFLSPRLRLIPVFGAHSPSGIKPIGSVLWPNPGEDNSTPVAAEASLQGAEMRAGRSSLVSRGELQGERKAAFFTSPGCDVLRPVDEVPPRNGEIDAGMELERSNREFLHNGLLFDAGTWRVLSVRAGSCCERQGTCGPGDIIVALNGVNAAQADKSQLVSLLRGMAGSSISVEVVHQDCRHAVSRQLILAPSPADLGISSRSRY